MTELTEDRMGLVLAGNAERVYKTNVWVDEDCGAKGKSPRHSHVASADRQAGTKGECP